MQRWESGASGTLGLKERRGTQVTGGWARVPRGPQSPEMGPTGSVGRRKALVA